MQKPVIGVVGLVVGAIIGAGGWAVIGPAKTKTVHDTAAATASSGPAAHHTVRHYATAQAIADRLEAAGFTVSMLHKGSDDGLDLGMDASYDFTITEKPGRAPGDSLINMFRNHDALDTWVGLSQGFGGIAVTGDTWAVSLATDNPASVNLSKKMAPRIAQVLGGTVAE